MSAPAAMKRLRRLDFPTRLHLGSQVRNQEGLDRTALILSERSDRCQRSVVNRHATRAPWIVNTLMLRKRFLTNHSQVLKTCPSAGMRHCASYHDHRFKLLPRLEHDAVPQIAYESSVDGAPLYENTHNFKEICHVSDGFDLNR